MNLIDVKEIPKGPRLELRWTLEGTDELERVIHKCEYLLLIPLAEGDIRRDAEDCEDGMVKIRFSTTRDRKQVWEGIDPMLCDGRIILPHRDGKHAGWDSAHLGNLPVWATYNGKAMRVVYGPGGNA